MSRELIYRLSIQTNDAKRQAANIRSTFERELRQIQAGNINFSAATGQARQLSAELNNVAASGQKVKAALPGGTDFFSAGINDAIAQVQNLATAYIGLQGITAVIDLSKLGTQAQRTYASLNILAGGGEKAEEVLKAIQKASNGTVTEMEAAGIATQGFALKLARTPAEFEKLTRAAREIVQVSPIINDVSEALTQLALFASNEQSFARADQLGLAVGEVKDRMAELRRENDALSGSQAKLLASVQLLDEKYGATLDTIEAQATGIEKLRVAWEDAKVSFATADFGVGAEFFSVDRFANSIANSISVLSGNYSDLQAVADRVKGTIGTLENRKTAFFFPEDTQPQIDKLNAGFESYKKAVDEVNRAVAAGTPGADEYQARLAALSLTIVQSGGINDAQVAQLQELHNWYNQTAQSVVSLAEAEKLRAENKISADQFENTRQATIFEQQPAIEQALAGRAGKSADVVGIEAAIAIYRQQKAAVDAAIQQLIDSGVSDQNEIAIRVSAITAELMAPFDALEARASTIDLTAALGNFDQVGAALSSLNAGFVDFLPGVSSAREELTTLSTEMALTGELSDEQAARLEYLSAVAYSVADGGSQLSAVINDLGNDFLASNAYAAELVNQLVLTEAAYRNGAITGDIYAGVTAALTGKLLTLAQGAGIATGAIYALNDAQADMASPAGLAIGGSIANRIQSQQQTSGREQNRREMERYNKDLARSQERSAGRAGKLLEDGAKKANQELKSALDKVPGLFSASQVTEQDMKDAELGVYQEKADEYLRRLRDEVQNGNDWEDVSLEEARAGLERAGLEVGSTAEQTVALLEKAINDSSLYSAVENIPIFINEEAVKFTQELQSKSEQGRKNIYEYFGIQVDEAVGAATGGGGGGGGVAVRPPELIDIDPLTEGLQTGLDEYVNASGEMVKEQMAKAKALFFDPANLFGSTAASGKPGAMGPVAKPEITVTADATAQAWLPVVTGQTTTATVALGVAGPQAAPSMDGEKTKLLITDYYEVVTPEGGKVKLAAADFFTFDGSAPVETVNRADLVTFTNALPVEQVNRAKLVSFLSELPTEQIDRSALVAFVSEVSKEEIDRSGLVSFLSELPTEQVDRSTLIGYINSPATETVDRAELISFANALPAENIDRSALISFLGSVPSEAVDRQTLVSYLNSVPTETIDRANVVAFLGSVPSEQVDRTALVAYTGAVPIFTVDLSKVVEFAGEAVRAAQDKLYSFLYGPSPERPDTAPGITDAGPYAIDIQAQLSPAAYQSYLDYKAEVEANPPTIMPMLQAPGQRLGDVEPLGTIDVTANITKFDVTAQIDETALASLTAPIVYAPQSDAQADFITPLVTGLTTQIGANQDQIGAQGASVAQIIIAGMIAAFQGTQQGGEATTTISDALFFAVNTQFTTAQSSFFTVGSIPAVAVESGFKGYAYDGLSSGLLDALTNGIRADADAYMQRGATIAGYVQKGIGDGFSSDIGIRSAVTAGGVWGNAFMQGALNAINAAGFVDQITTAVVDGITDQVEQP